MQYCFGRLGCKSGGCFHKLSSQSFYFQAALYDAEHVLLKDPHFVKAIYGKAESLFNLCQFEHALVQYHQGKVRFW